MSNAPATTRTTTIKETNRQCSPTCQKLCVALRCLLVPVTPPSEAACLGHRTARALFEERREGSLPLGDNVPGVAGPRPGRKSRCEGGPWSLGDGPRFLRTLRDYLIDQGLEERSVSESSQASESTSPSEGYPYDLAVCEVVSSDGALRFRIRPIRSDDRERLAGVSSTTCPTAPATSDSSHCIPDPAQQIGRAVHGMFDDEDRLALGGRVRLRVHRSRSL